MTLPKGIRGTGRGRCGVANLALRKDNSQHNDIIKKRAKETCQRLPSAFFPTIPYLYDLRLEHHSCCQSFHYSTYYRCDDNSVSKLIHYSPVLLDSFQEPLLLFIFVGIDTLIHNYFKIDISASHGTLTTRLSLFCSSCHSRHFELSRFLIPATVIEKSLFLSPPIFFKLRSSCPTAPTDDSSSPIGCICSTSISFFSHCSQLFENAWQSLVTRLLVELLSVAVLQWQNKGSLSWCGCIQLMSFYLIQNER